ncbi:hypothetical protein ZWY2020_017327 [Hordeum vulgare]|nr:hypothetical protein ZWY2020_019797 [Hordeum vulgare]KAI4984697.1 hypothetical protein ZWY2020_017327 [Hordeum vulgare]
MEKNEPEEDEAELHAPGLNMTEAEAKFVVAQAEKMVEQQAIFDSIRDEAEVKANRQLIRQRHVETDALFDELDAKTVTKEAAAEQPEAPEGFVAQTSEGAKLQLPHFYLSKGTEIVEILDEE